ncbi:hypothetical protein IMG5_114870 [Ichthyophthirius multifiliis]|uniref:Transmembrane protein n=1 Tax=Ichthyophthirius multifiliis TaxID=5932 RepID=G0QU53_ICHMU|nr:hypothetical protein IMG5_114870 [Ichthyophthirius multifiliis]EGR31277.1 hypothetical protein IMG5_114870 [Ichthyophthirius multifiliis]|eukprot:XP_004034763.1 hypothetical protein IMG5_114870 [Ichthyophthirius multifiliis]
MILGICIQILLYNYIIVQKKITSILNLQVKGQKSRKINGLKLINSLSLIYIVFFFFEKLQIIQLFVQKFKFFQNKTLKKKIFLKSCSIQFCLFFSIHILCLYIIKQQLRFYSIKQKLYLIRPIWKFHLQSFLCFNQFYFFSKRFNQFIHHFLQSLKCNLYIQLYFFFIKFLLKFAYFFNLILIIYKLRIILAIPRIKFYFEFVIFSINIIQNLICNILVIQIIFNIFLIFLFIIYVFFFFIQNKALRSLLFIYLYQLVFKFYFILIAFFSLCAIFIPLLYFITILSSNQWQYQISIFILFSFVNITL